MNIRSKNVIVDYRIDSTAIEKLKSYGFNVILTKKVNALYKAVDGHPDLQIVKVGNNLIVAPELADYYSSQLNKNIIRGTHELKSKYPHDVYYNAAIFDKFCIHNFKFTDEALMQSISEKALIRINTNQGYSKCSVCIVSGNAIITEDESIYESSKLYGIDVLKINKGCVNLPGLNYGFFGGATGLYEQKLFVNGELKYHSDCNKIKSFCEKHDVQVIELKRGAIVDIGSLVFIN